MTNSPYGLSNYLSDQVIARKDFSRSLGISTNYLTELLTGRRVPTLSLAIEIWRATKQRVHPSYWVDPGSPADLRSKSQIATTPENVKETAP